MDQAIRPRLLWVEFLRLFRDSPLEPIAAVLIDRECDRLERLLDRRDAAEAEHKRQKAEAGKAVAAFRRAQRRQQDWSNSLRRAIEQRSRDEIEAAAQRVLDEMKSNPEMVREFKRQKDPIAHILELGTRAEECSRTYLGDI